MDSLQPLKFQWLSLFQQIDFYIDFPKNLFKEKLFFHGRVVWVVKTVDSEGKDAYDVGIEFMALKKKEQTKIDRFVYAMSK